MPENWSEIELAKLCSERNHSAEKELYIRYAARINMLCLRYLPKEDARDMVHDVFIKVFDKIGSYKYYNEGSLYAWIRKVALNSILERFRKHRYAFFSLDLFKESYLAEPEEEEVMQIPEDILLGFIAQLPEGRRTIFNLYCIEGYSHRDIAQMLNISEKGSAAILAKARGQIKKSVWDYLEKQK